MNLLLFNRNHNEFFLESHYIQNVFVQTHAPLQSQTRCRPKKKKNHTLFTT